ncbi:MAG: hypothetical protein QME21_00435 [Anaerolineales bacterium]|nr:hypothetical protein [Anaerolineales bacterium]
MNRKSKRFDPTRWTSRLVPVVLAVLFLGLLVTLAIIILAALGLTPSY